MPHIITYTEEIEERGYCQQRPELKTGDKYLHEVDGKMRLRIVRSVHFDKYVWENVAQWTTVIEEYFEEEYKMEILPMNTGNPQSYVEVGVHPTFSSSRHSSCPHGLCAQLHENVPVFIAKSLIGVLTCDQDKVQGELFIPSFIGRRAIKGIAPFGFYGCRHLKTVVIDSPVVIAYKYAFAKSGVEEMRFNEEVPVMLHITALDDCENIPKFDRLFDRPFPGKYLFRGGEAFHEWEEDLRKNHFLPN